uniref:Uncharacterized protein n=1 Tax=Physcomitrium patens TaxID=3218 RepID=A0A2K1JHA9_PHYPA|nr:hypothetical protein PHYPA_018353 [Physcomitrium patens]
MARCVFEIRRCIFYSNTADSLPVTPSHPPRFLVVSCLTCNCSPRMSSIRVLSCTNTAAETRNIFQLLKFMTVHFRQWFLAVDCNECLVLWARLDMS